MTRSITAGIGVVSVVTLAACAPDEEAAQPEEPQETVTETATPAPETEQPAETETVTEEPEAEPTEPEAEEPPDRSDLPPEERDYPEGGAEQVPDEELPGDGEPETLFYGEEGDELGVAGLDPEDAPLEVYAAPAPNGEAEVVGGLHPTDAVIMTGRERHSPGDDDFGTWAEIELADGYGWVDGDLSHFGGTDDVTSNYIDDVPPAEDPQVIAEGVAERSLGADIQDVDDGEQAGPDWTLISAPADYGEDFYRIDTTGLRDDAQMGDRLFVYVEESADGYELTQVEATNLCRRGVTDDGLCL